MHVKPSLEIREDEGKCELSSYSCSIVEGRKLGSVLIRRNVRRLQISFDEFRF